MSFLDPVQKKGNPLGQTSCTKPCCRLQPRKEQLIECQKSEFTCSTSPKCHSHKFPQIKPSPRAKTLQLKVLVRTLILMSQHKTRWQRSQSPLELRLGWKQKHWSEAQGMKRFRHFGLQTVLTQKCISRFHAQPQACGYLC